MIDENSKSFRLNWVRYNFHDLMRLNHILECVRSGIAQDILREITVGPHPCTISDGDLDTLFRALVLDERINVDCAAEAFFSAAKIRDARIEADSSTEEMNQDGRVRRKRMA